MSSSFNAANSLAPLTLLKDAAVLGLLGGALLGVGVVDAFLAPPPREDGNTVSVTPLVEEVTVTTVEEELPAKQLRLAVTPHIAAGIADFDDMGKMLNLLGKGYEYSALPLDQLHATEGLGDYDVVFLTCGTVPEGWLSGEDVGAGDRNTVSRMMRPEIAQRVRDNLRSFVEQGGTLYASDWRFQILQMCFPELIDDAAVKPGGKQEVTADVVEKGLQEFLGNHLELNFDLPGWYPAALSDHKMTTYLEGTYATVDGEQHKAPLLVKVPYGKGAIVFTSFHNEKQNSKAEIELLKYLVFTTVTARVESEVRETMVRGGFSPKKQNLLSTSSESPSVSKTYDNDRNGLLRFVLAFEQQGARLRLTVVGPDGKKHEQTASKTITIDVPNAKVGSWKYTVTAEKVPFENYPFTVTVGQK